MMHSCFSANVILACRDRFRISYFFLSPLPSFVHYFYLIYHLPSSDCILLLLFFAFLFNFLFSILIFLLFLLFLFFNSSCYPSFSPFFYPLLLYPDGVRAFAASLPPHLCGVGEEGALVREYSDLQERSRWTLHRCQPALARDRNGEHRGRLLSRPAAVQGEIRGEMTSLEIMSR